MEINYLLLYRDYLNCRWDANQIQVLPIARCQARWAKLGIEMPNQADRAEASGGQVRLPAGVVLKPPVSLEDLKTDTEHDPHGAEQLVALIRALRNQGSRPVTL